jgi:hypothetical protein
VIICFEYHHASSLRNLRVLHLSWVQIATCVRKHNLLATPGCVVIDLTTTEELNEDSRIFFVHSLTF